MKRDIENFEFLLLRCNSLIDASNLLASHVVSGGFTRAVVCHFSTDRAALVVQGAASTEGIHSLDGYRMLIHNSLRSIFEDGSISPKAYYKLGTEKIGGVLWFDALGLPSVDVWLEFPIYNESQPLGIMFCDEGEEKTRTLETSAIATSTSRLVESYSCRAALLIRGNESSALVGAEDALLGLDREIGSVLLDLPNNNPERFEPIFRSVARYTVTITGAEACEICLERGNYYNPVAQAGKLSMIGQTKKSGDRSDDSSITMNAINSGQAKIYTGYRTDPTFNSMLHSLKEEEDIETLLSIRAWGSFPIVANGAVRGAISVASSYWDFFQPWKIKLLTLIAEKISLILTRMIHKPCRRTKYPSISVGC